MARYLRQTRGAAFDAVLRVSAQFGVSVPLDAVREAAAAFVAYWADNPSAGYDPLAWPQDPPVNDMLRDELSDRILHRPSSATIIADKWWNQFPGWAAERADITSPLDCELLSAAMAHSDQRDRLRIVEVNLSPGPFGATSGHYRELADVLWARTRPTTKEFRVLYRLLPAATDLDAGLFTGLVARATGEPPGLPELELCGDLAKKQLLVLDAATIKLLDYDRELQSFESCMAAASPPPDSRKLLRQVPRSLLMAHGEQLTRGLLAIDDPEQVMYLVRQLPPQIAGNTCVHGATSPCRPSGPRG